MNRLMPELFNTVPVLNLTALQQITNVVAALVCSGLISDKEIELRIVKVVFFGNSAFLLTHT